MVAPKSILRNEASAQATHGVLHKLLPPFMRQKSTSFAPETTEYAKRDYGGYKGERLDESAVRYEDDSIVQDPVKDERVNMSLTFVDKLIDDISMMLTFENDTPKVVDEPSIDVAQQQSLEITFDNYVEYEALKKKKAQTSDDESVQAQCLVTHPEDQIDDDDESKLTEDDFSGVIVEKWSEHDAARLDKLERELLDMRVLKEVEKKALLALREKRKKLRKQGAKVKDEKDAKFQRAAGEMNATYLTEVQHELDELRKLKVRVVQAKENAKVQKAIVELAAFKVSRDPIEFTVQKRLEASLAVVQEHRAAQQKIEAEVAAVKARMSKFQPIVEHVSPVDPAQNLLVPPGLAAEFQDPKYLVDNFPEPVPVPIADEDLDDDVREDVVSEIENVASVVSTPDVLVSHLTSGEDAGKSRPEPVELLSRPTNARRAKPFNLENACCGALALD